MTSAKLSPPTIFVGLGNPGEQYLKTRHNMGYWFLDLFADHHHASMFKSESRLLGSAAQVSLAERKLLLVKPSTFMNESGESIRRFLHYYKFDLSHLCVIHDDLDLQYGSSKIKFDGGHGGHNGLRNV
ncbi:MAG TPA: aminoacyl-tRNA hydrolase, partial [Gammaproteobacteria bacterium]|nr:aminoacyl-tRNA hydrolase [Gammaproteobacteria bacterium]